MKYKGKTIVEIAHQRGCNGNVKKKDTAWQYLLNSIKPDHTPLEKRSTCTSYLSRTTTRAEYQKMIWIERLEEPGSGDKLCHLHGHETREELSARLIAAGKYTEEALLPHDIRKRAEIKERYNYNSTKTHVFDLHNFPDEPQDWNSPAYTLQIAGRLIRFTRKDNATWEGNNYYPSSSTIMRTASLIRLDAECLSSKTLLTNSNPTEVESSISYEARGNWLIKAVAALLKIPPQTQRGLSHVQLDKHFRVRIIRKIGTIEIYKRTLAGETYDYCAVKDKNTYHAETPREAVNGLQYKIAAPGSRKERIDMEYALSLGFCRSGIEQFCDDYGLDSDGTYNRSEIQGMISQGNGRAKKYQTELEKAGFDIGISSSVKEVTV